ncbi:MAG TPA: ornithine carbamoyltransferase [Candidatus Dormibacteraeota bacterium]|nr:ornithine carbamoyltransferase [Candidatus Dormibacteraeota bacterium]
MSVTAVERRVTAPGLVSGMEWTPGQVRDVLRLAAKMKAHPNRYRNALDGRFVALIFEKPSLRTRVTLDVGATSLGAKAVFVDNSLSRLGEREPVRDVAKNLERWVQAIAVRTFSQENVDDLARHAAIPVINALSDRFHPCQALADIFTLEERFGSLAGLKLAFVGDGNNVCHSLLIAGAQTGVAVRIASPSGYEPAREVVRTARRLARETGASIEFFDSPEEAVTDAQAVYTDTWTSMGQERESTVREKMFAPYQVNRRLFDQAAPDAVFLHCLPAHRGREVTEDVIDSPQSIIYEQAENRLHITKAILATLVG